MRTWVTAPMSLPSWIIGLPDRCDVNKDNSIDCLKHLYIFRMYDSDELRLAEKDICGTIIYAFTNF